MGKLTEDFPHSQILIDAGYTTELKVQKATDEELLAIEGFGPASLKDVRAATSSSAVEDEVAAETSEGTPYACPNPVCGHTITSSPCPYCGQ